VAEPRRGTGELEQLLATDGATWRVGEKPAGVGRAAGGRAGGPGGGVRAVRGS
jgi:hypothetical protein